MAKTMGVVTKSDTYWSLIDGRTKYKWDMADSFDAGKSEGIAQGRNEGLAEGIIKGREEGIKRGIEQGAVQEKERLLRQLAKALGKDESELRKYVEEENTKNAAK